MTVLAVIGPTASGKSAVALEAAAVRTAAGYPTEIVAVDAFTVYRGMDIATAKPSVEDRRRIAHHLVDIVDPDTALTVAAFQAIAREVIEAILARGATPLLVGGSGLYWRAVVDDLAFPPTDPDVRARIQARWEDDVDEAHKHLAIEDPDAAAAIAPGNLRRIVRALEVIALTSRPFSSFRTAFDRFDSIYDDLDVTLLDPPDNALKASITRRADGMVAAGLLAEADRLRRTSLSVTARQAIGYAEAFAVLEGHMPQDELAVTIAQRTWRYARRQRSWFRKDPRAVVRDRSAAARHLQTGGNDAV
ncbi:MAG: tRNA (adenosine(37)-N6)-dimethylallyltransferase MiaA [Nitriliruptoraceae bacterium]